MTTRQFPWRSALKSAGLVLLQLIPGKIRQIALVMAAPLLVLTSARAQIQTAGTVYVNMDATTLSPGVQASVTNSGSLGGYFVATNLFPSSQSILVTNISAGSPPALLLGGLSATNYLTLQTAGDGSGSLIPVPAGLTGTDAPGTIEVWAYNPAVANEETMVAWGARKSGLNMAFEYGTSGNAGAVSHFGSGDSSWDVQAGGGAPQTHNWHHLVYTCDGATESIYCDGALVNQISLATNAYSITNNSGIALGAQWNLAGGITNNPCFGTLAVARVRIESGALTAAQVLANYTLEKSTFQTTTPQFLTAPPVHRYSFDLPATNDATGLTVPDSIGGPAYDAMIQGSEQSEVPAFSGRQLELPGGLNIPTTDYGGPYAQLPAGLVSVNSTNNGGTGEFSVEIWFKNTAGKAWSWSRIFDAGSAGAAQVGNQIIGPGGYASGWRAMDNLQISAQNGGSVNQHRLEWKNFDVAPAGSTTNDTAVNADGTLLNSYQAEQHVVVTWKESTGEIIAYVDGLPLTSMYVSNSMSALNDLNIWLGRSNNGDNGTAGAYDEVRFYNYVLSPGQVLGDYQAGCATINTNQQAVAITAPPENVTVWQGWPASLSLIASGSPAVSYQWYFGGSAIAGATNDTYSLSAADLSDAGSYFCVASNFAFSTPTVVTSTVATLSVTPNQAPAPQLLHETRDANPSASLTSNGQRDNYSGTVGCSFTVGAAGALVTHVGMYDVYGDGLNVDHGVELYTSHGVLIQSNDVPIGTGGYLTNGYRYVALNPPVYLAPGSSNFLQAEVYSGDGDMWADAWTPALWNGYFVGANGPGTRQAKYGGNGSWANGPSTGNGTYGAPNLAALPIGPAVIAVLQTNLTGPAGTNLTLIAGADGAPPVNIQWYKAGSGPLTGQTNSTLVLQNTVISDSGTYYAVASNGLGTMQSSNITVLIDTPVTITQQPTNTTVPEGFSATFFIGTFGSLPISYQWRSNDVPLVGETNSSYTIPATTLAQSGSLYSCVVSNFASGAPQVVASQEATLTVQPNVASAGQMLYGGIGTLRDDFNGTVGGAFEVGSTPAWVTHLGFYAANASLNYSHEVDILQGTNVVASVNIGGTGDIETNGYFWVALGTPVLLQTNTSYVLAGDVYLGDGDSWPSDNFTPLWNPYYIGSTPGSTRSDRWGGGYLPSVPTGSSSPNIYSAVNLGILPAGAATVAMMQTSVTQYTGFSAEFDGFANGDAPLTVQWYKQDGTLLAGQTNLSLVIANPTGSDSGGYYMVASNDLGSTQGPIVTLTVLAPQAPSIDQPPQSQSAYPGQTVYFTASASGTPVLSYQWSFNNSPIPGATNSSLVLTGVTAASEGTYSLVVTNDYGSAPASATLTMQTPAPGSFEAEAINEGPLVYYPLEDVTNGTGLAFNAGVFGAPFDGMYQGDYTNGAGPQPPDFAGFSATNQALVLDGTNTDVSIPALNLDTNSVAGESMVAWIYSEVNPSVSSTPFYAQAPDAGILILRTASDGANGLSTTYDPTNGLDMLRYTWNNTYWQLNTFLDVPTNQWVFIALSVHPDRAEVYLNDGSGMKSYTNNAAHNPVAFSGPTYVGHDPGFGARWFNGLIDAPMIFNRALSADELNRLYQAGRTGIAPSVQVQITTSGGNIILTWPTGTLLEATNLTGPWLTNNSASPYTNTPAGSQKFYRVQVQ